jgi:hypothetical protein
MGARGGRHTFRNVGDKPARVLILSAPSCSLDQTFAELEAATAAGMPEFGKLVAIAGKYAIEPPTAPDAEPTFFKSGRNRARWIGHETNVETRRRR